MTIISRGELDTTIYRAPPINVFRSDTFFGYNPGIGTGAFEDVWPAGGTRVWIDTPTTIDVASTSPLDTFDGIGVRTVRLIGLDADFNQFVEFVTMNGTDSVATTNTFKRLNSVEVITVGQFNDSNTNPNVGTISFTAGSDLQMTIQDFTDGGSTGRGTFLGGTIPAQHTGYIDTIGASSLPKQDVSLNLFIRSVEDQQGDDFAPRIEVFKGFFPDGLTTIILDTPIILPSKHDVWATSKNLDTGTLQILVGMQVRIVRNV